MVAAGEFALGGGAAGGAGAGRGGAPAAAGGRVEVIVQNKKMVRSTIKVISMITVKETILPMLR